MKHIATTFIPKFIFKIQISSHEFKYATSYVKNKRYILLYKSNEFKTINTARNVLTEAK